MSTHLTSIDLSGLDPARLVTAPITPAHLAFATGRGLWAFPSWLEYLNDEVTDFLLDPEPGFLAVEVPVRHGKSEFISINVVAWYLGMFPQRRVLMTSYSHDLIKGFSAAARDKLAEFGPSLFGVTTIGKANEWRVTDLEGHPLALGGNPSCRAVSRGGQITGSGGDLIVIDDPIKDAGEADSKLARNQLWTWYTRTLRNRLEPTFGGKIILVMARWHDDDLAARVFDKKYASELADQWRRIHLPAIAEPSPDEEEQAREAGVVIDLSEWRDELGRKRGEALWPERYSRDRLLQIQASVGPLGWSSNFQQRPSSAEGGMFPRHKWGAVNEWPKECDLVRRWDLAATEGGGDWTAGTLLGLDRRKNTYVIDVTRGQFGPSELEEWVREVVATDARTYGRARVHHVLEQEPGSSGKIVVDRWKRDLFAGHSVESKGTSANKERMAQPMAGQQNAGNVHLVRRIREDGSYGPAPWWDDFVDESADFPRGAHDDMIDAASKAYLDLVARFDKKSKSKTRTTSVANRRIG